MESAETKQYKVLKDFDGHEVGAEIALEANEATQVLLDNGSIELVAPAIDASTEAGSEAGAASTDEAAA